MASVFLLSESPCGGRERRPRPPPPSLRPAAPPMEEEVRMVRPARRGRSGLPGARKPGGLRGTRRRGECHSPGEMAPARLRPPPPPRTRRAPAQPTALARGSAAPFRAGVERPLGRAGGACLPTEPPGAVRAIHVHPPGNGLRLRPRPAPAGSADPIGAPAAPLSGPAQSSESVHPSTPPSRGFKDGGGGPLKPLGVHPPPSEILRGFGCPRRPGQEAGTPADRRRAELTAESRTGHGRGLQTALSAARRPAEAAAIFLLPPPAERAKLPESCGGRRRRPRSRRPAARLPSGGPRAAAAPPLPGLCWARR
ncbi:collagen alpha-1(I) chain-like [Peromyscus leucopus]|uniref:collagen alpha-1(I) chain-like n=1 Tax=Peromyscus leucopus TaxID=10041 RepID=UPI0010A1B020|nr:collagen alpha-1(I) chain-like [Peromyscus leucopus]